MQFKINITFFLVFILLNNSLLAQEYSFLSPIQLNGSRGKSITTADLNKDNAPDIIHGTFDPGKINIFLNDGLGNLTRMQIFHTLPAAVRLVLQLGILTKILIWISLPPIILIQPFPFFGGVVMAVFMIQIL